MTETHDTDTDRELRIHQTLGRIRRNLNAPDCPVGEQVNWEPGHYFVPEALDGFTRK